MRRHPSYPFARAIAIALTACCQVLQGVAAAPGDRTDPADSSWQYIDVRAHLDAEGVLHASEHVSLAIAGDEAAAERSFRSGLDAEVGVLRVVRLDHEGGPHALALGPLDAVDRYEFDRHGVRWSLPGARDPATATTTSLAYRIEYTISGAVIPIWGIRPFGESTILSPFMLHPLRRLDALWQAWRLAPGAWGSRYALDHDFSPFPSLGGKPISRVGLQLTADPVWSLREPLNREWHRIAAGDEVRAFIPLDFRDAGVPVAVSRVRHAAWLAPVAILPLASIGLWLALFLGQWRRRRRYDQTPVDETWIRLHVLARAPAEIASLLTSSHAQVSPGAPAILEEMARQGKIEFDQQSSGGTLRIRAPRDVLKPWERAVVERLFGHADRVDRESLERRRSASGRLDLDGAARRAFKAAHAERMRWTLRSLPTLLLVALGIGLMASALAVGGLQALVVSIVVGSIAFGNVHAAAKRLGGSPDLPLLPLAVLLVPPLVFSAAAFVYFLAVPAYPRAIAGLAALGMGLANALFNAAKPPPGEAGRELRYGLARARKYIGRQLRKPRPALDDAWLRWIVALGLGREADAWRSRQLPGAPGLQDPAACSATGRWSGGTTSALEEG